LASDEPASAAVSVLKARKIVIAVDAKVMFVSPGVPPLAAEFWIVNDVAELRPVM
jgi:hypothetical protein